VPRFRGQVRALARDLAAGPHVPALLEAKRRARRLDEQHKPLRTYRAEELAKSYECFFGEDRSYHEARHRFVHKLGAPCVVTPARAARVPARVRRSGAR
jgi:putative two-component system protein, hydrogenase maturation factor HypX/HoxX